MITAWTKISMVPNAEQRMGFDVYNSKRTWQCVAVGTREWQLQCCDLRDGREAKPWRVSTVLLVLVFSGGLHWSDGVCKQCTHLPHWGHFASRGRRWYQSSHCPPSYRLPAAEEWGNLDIALQLLPDTTSGSWCLGRGAAPTSQSSLKC